MTITILGDFADPLSFLASQRVEQIRSLDLHDIQRFAVEADRARPMGGRRLEPASIERVRSLAAPGEAVPVPDVCVTDRRAATVAYAESLTDGVPDAMRCALFDALWLHGRGVSDPDVIRQIVFDVLNPLPPTGDIDWRIRANLPIVPLGTADPITTTRRLGLIVSMGRGPLTVTGQSRIDKWRQLWQRRGAPTLPLLLTDLGEAFAGERALTWLADRLPHRGPAVTAAAAAKAKQCPAELPQAPDENVSAVMATATQPLGAPTSRGSGTMAALLRAAPGIGRRLSRTVTNRALGNAASATEALRRQNRDRATLQPPGDDGTPRGTGEVSRLSREECMRLLETRHIGRFVYVARADTPDVVPVNYALDKDGSILVRSGPGPKLSAAQQHARVAFEVDEIDDRGRTGWSVVVAGHAGTVTNQDNPRLSELIQPWAAGARRTLIRINPTPRRRTSPQLTLRAAARYDADTGGCGSPTPRRPRTHGSNQHRYSRARGSRGRSAGHRDTAGHRGARGRLLCPSYR